MRYQPIITDKVMIFNLETPIYGSFYGIWDKWLKIAKARGLKLVVETKDGKSTYKSADEYIRGAKRMERYFKNPKVPMIFWGRNFLPDIKEREERKKKEEHKEVGQVSFFEAYLNMPDRVRDKIRAKLNIS